MSGGAGGTINSIIRRGLVGDWLRAAVLAVLLTFAGQTFLTPAPAGVVNLPKAERGPKSVADVAAALQSAVVNISTEQGAPAEQAFPPQQPVPPPGQRDERFFEDFLERQQRGGEKRVNSLGSGFVIDPSGLIVTNNHVIEGAENIYVNFSDGTKLKVVEIVGRDIKVDLALLRVNPPKPLTAVAFGDSGKMRVGDWVMAIGNPFGLGGSVTVGILSATRRDINSGPYDEFLQTDAAINRGNSGGPLFNMDGEVIGINTAIISPTGGSIGIGFAVPSNTVALVVEQLRRYGQTRRGWIGVRIQNVGEDIAESLGMKTAAGALIANVTPGGPAAKAGLKVGDIILAYDGQDVTELRGLPRLVAQTEVGRVVEVKVWRETEKKTITLRIRVEKLDEGDPAAGKTLRKSEAPAGDGGFMLGLALAPLSDELRSLFAIGETVDGVLVTAIDADSPTGGTPLRPGNVILEVTSEKVKTPEDFASRIAALRALQRKTALLLVADASGEMNFVPLPIGD